MSPLSTDDFVNEIGQIIKVNDPVVYVGTCRGIPRISMGTYKGIQRKLVKGFDPVTSSMVWKPSITAVYVLANSRMRILPLKRIYSAGTKLSELKGKWL